MYEQLRRHVTMLWRTVRELKSGLDALRAMADEHHQRLHIIENSIMDRSARFEAETLEMRQLAADVEARLGVGGRVIAGELRPPDI